MFERYWIRRSVLDKFLNDQDLVAMYERLGISRETYESGLRALDALKERFERIDRIAEYNQMKVLAAMQECHVGESDLLATTGYGYNDEGRDKLERVYAGTFHTEDAVVRPQLIRAHTRLQWPYSAFYARGTSFFRSQGNPMTHWMM